MAKATQPVSINGLEFDALIDEDRAFESEVPEYTVEEGFPVSDHIVFRAETLAMTLFVTHTPVTWHKSHGGDPNRVANVLQQLEEIYYGGKPVTIVTSDKTYTDMAILSFNYKKSKDVGYSREIPISFKKIRVAQATTTTIPDSYGKSGTTEAPAGTASTTKSSARYASNAAATKRKSSGSYSKKGSSNLTDTQNKNMNTGSNLSDAQLKSVQSSKSTSKKSTKMNGAWSSLTKLGRG